MLDNVEFAAALREAVRIRCDAWSGTTSELLTMVPGAAADGTRLARRLTDAAADLAAAGVTVERRRQPGTGARQVGKSVDSDENGQPPGWPFSSDG